MKKEWLQTSKILCWNSGESEITLVLRKVTSEWFYKVVHDGMWIDLVTVKFERQYSLSLWPQKSQVFLSWVVSSFAFCYHYTLVEVDGIEWGLQK